MNYHHLKLWTKPLIINRDAQYSYMFNMLILPDLNNGLDHFQFWTVPVTITKQLQTVNEQR